MEPLIIGLATAEDAAAVRVLVEHFLAATPYGGQMPETPELDRRITEFLSGTHGFILKATQGSKIVGIMAVVIFPNLLTGDIVAGEVVWWVEPEARTTGAGLALLDTAATTVAARGARSMQIVAHSPALKRLFRRLGYSELETVFTKPLTEQSPCPSEQPPRLLSA